MPAGAKQLLLAGVTSARDLGAPLDDSIDVRNKINNGEMAGATLYMSGPFIQHEPYPGTEVFRWGVNGVDDARAKVKKLADGGVDVIKLIDQDQMTLEEVKAVVDEAHRRNLPVVAHSHRPEEIRRGILAGVDNFEHTGLAAAPEYPDDIIKAIRERAAQHGDGPAVLDADHRGPLQLRVHPRQPGAHRRHRVARGPADEHRRRHQAVARPTRSASTTSAPRRRAARRWRASSTSCAKPA